MDRWQTCVNQTSKARRAQFRWKITSTAEGLRVQTSVRSFHDLARLVEQIRRIVSTHDEEKSLGLAIQPTPGLFDIWTEWCTPKRLRFPKDYPIDISKEQTDHLVELFCRTPCCSTSRIPFINPAEFLARYRSSPAYQPSTLLVYAVCAMAARNAFQLHVWGNRPSHESPQYNIGKPLSIAYCLRARELLAESFDEPSMDNCKAALLLSYCSHQNGYPHVIYFYEWIAFTMAQQLGLYDSNRTLTREENMLVWSLYYYNTWYRVLRGNTGSSLRSSAFFPHQPLPEVMTPNSKKEADIIECYAHNMWVYMFELLLLLDDTMARLIDTQDSATHRTLMDEVCIMQSKLDSFYARLPSDWQRCPSVTGRCHSSDHDEYYHVDAASFTQFCIQNVQIQYNINQILLHQGFLPGKPSSGKWYPVDRLCTCIDAANFIIRSMDRMIKESEGCCVPFVGIIFCNLVYCKLLNYDEGHYRDLARRCLKRSVDLAKASKSYQYDFEMARTMVDLLEQNIPTS
ncbi:hypothetical protein EC973_009197 [Apophysomyces ossiformis]|uniref:Xylanolytic transcriptional activator regulatory domain-containing protein n=1 Tax=Apophysomyces ossiformis TaxID=679940 RepID=A0A8H7ENJ2_9FUNG|nr:hypothetical protein EC973_009197 [Apophysomyces ossiformis]